jgi:hypothetical protein
MKRVFPLVAMGVMAVAVPLAGRSLAPAPVHAATMLKATLRVANAYKHNMHFAHAMASATISYTGHNATVKLTAENLPMPSVVRARTYVVWLTNGSMKDRAGALKVHGGMASLKATVMMTKVQDVVVTAEQSAMPMHPMGKTILSGMVG